MLFCEVGRLLSHLLNVTTQAMDVGALTPPLWGFEEREKLMVFYERASGSRLHAAYFRVGGVHQDLPPELLQDMYDFCEKFPKVLDDIEGLITENRQDAGVHNVGQRRRLSRNAFDKWRLPDVRGTIVPGKAIASRDVQVPPAIVAIDDSTSILCARVVRGINSMANSVTPH